ncbi:unnamed protein product [Eruca vesicaria subsp. sativa]|uniref:Uncharacterized protein n=1 Tax=Eruca vesicaria subsp. sativa TaxID=29727 RepID=A0ABC8KN68_ERUVS|nr:unnamed protein product [Eruca vesicaria subsp. sativa]
MVYVMKVEKAPLDSYVDFCVSLVTVIFSISCICILLNQEASRSTTTMPSSKGVTKQRHILRASRFCTNQGNKQSSSSIAKPSRAWINISDPRSFKTMGWYGRILHQKQPTPGKPFISPIFEKE